MKLIKSVVAAALVAGVSLVGAQSANAAFIKVRFRCPTASANGIPAYGSTTIVSGLTTSSLEPPKNVFVQTATISGVTSGATAFSVLRHISTGPCTPRTMAARRPEFVIAAARRQLPRPEPLRRRRQVRPDGGVPGGGVDPTTWVGSGRRTVLARHGRRLQRIPTASWSASLVATGRNVTVPEPTSMVLLGLGLLGAGIARRRSS